MEDCSPLIADFFSQLRTCCQRLEASCATLRASVNQPSASLPPSNSPELLTTLVDRIASTSQAVGNLESKTTEVISFQELLGHSMEIYKQNEAGIDAIEERLKEYGYTPVSVVSTKDNCVEQAKSCHQSNLSSEPTLLKQSTSCDVDTMIAPSNEVEESVCKFDHSTAQLGSRTFGHAKDRAKFDPFYSGTLTVQELGLSAAGLACLAEEDSMASIDYAVSSMGAEADCRPQENVHLTNSSEEEEHTDMALPGERVPFFTPVDKYEYSVCPTWLKMQISFEDLNEITDKMYSVLVKKEIGSQFTLDQEDIAALNAGNKMKPFLLLLVKLGRLRTGHDKGATVYHVTYD